jgi:hypothetical protein
MQSGFRMAKAFENRTKSSGFGIVVRSSVNWIQTSLNHFLTKRVITNILFMTKQSWLTTGRIHLVFECLLYLFKNRNLNCPVFECLQYLSVWFSDPHCNVVIRSYSTEPWCYQTLLCIYGYHSKTGRSSFWTVIFQTQFLFGFQMVF